jgi:stage II sporulation protein D
MKERKDKSYHLESSVLDQVFRHIARDDENDPLIQKALQAVRETQGQRLWSTAGRTLKAFYHSDCGGKTTTAKNVWNYGVNTGVVVDNSCPTSPKATWSLRLTKQELEKRLKLPGVQTISLLRPKSEARVLQVKLASAAGMEKILSANEFRQKLGFQDLKSALFEVREEGEHFLFQGRGFGHGVGLCQWGSRALGRQGKDYKQILQHYYPLAQLK